MRDDQISKPSGFSIEKGVPIPESRGGGRGKYPFREMEIGDSFFVAGKSTAKFSAHVHHHRKRHGLKFTTRTVTEDGVKGVRIWRTE